MRKLISSRVPLLFFTLLALTLFLGAAPTASAANGNGNGRDMVRIMVEWSPGRSAEVRQNVVAQGGEIRYEFNRINTFAISVPAAALNGITNNPHIVSWEEDVERELYGSVDIPALMDAMAVAASPAQSTPWGVTAVQAPDVWAAGHDGTGRTVCIIDTGYYRDHEDLPNTGVSGVSQISGEDWFEDGNGHGSHVAGTIAGEDNSVGVIGVAPGVDLFIVKFFDNTGVYVSGSSDLIAAAYSCADGGANVISMSLGGGRSSRSERNAFDDLHSQGVLSIAAAGNDGNTATSYPAGYANVVSVGALDSSYAIADFSQQNADVEISAPGVGVLSTVPYLNNSGLVVDGVTYAAGTIEFSPYGSATGTLVYGGLCDSTGSWNGAVVLCERGSISFYDKVHNVELSGGAAAVIYNNAPGGFSGTLGEGFTSSIPAISISQEDGQFLVANKLGSSGTVNSLAASEGSGYDNYNGTSMATPHVSAVAALIWSANPSWTNDDIREAMNATALDLGSAGRDNAFGYGLVQAADALDYLGGTTPPPPPPGDLTLAVNAYKVKGKKTADLSWSGAASTNVDIYYNGSLLVTTANDGAFTHNLGTKGGGSATYQVCEAGTSTCSAVVNVSW